MKGAASRVRLRAPFPWFGGKSRVAHQVWDRFGDVANYVEPFAGSLAVLLARPTEPRIETVNDADCYLANFWRAVSAAPEEVAHWADWPVNEADMHARHQWLVNQAEFRERMKGDPNYWDAMIAGWWVWGVSQWIGSGWCSHADVNGPGRESPKGEVWEKRPVMDRGRGVQSDWSGRINGTSKPRGIHGRDVAKDRRPQLTCANGVHSSEWETRPALGSGNGVHQKRPRLTGWGNTGVHKKNVPHKRPMVGGDQPGRGVHCEFPSGQIPDVAGSRGATGRGVHASARTLGLIDWMMALQERLRRVRVCCGDFERVLGPSPTTHIGVTAVFLDPPYGEKAGRKRDIYSVDSLTVAERARKWAIENGGNPKLRIALCGYEGEHDMPPDWECVAWKANGGYSNRSERKKNAGKERIWFSPHCLKPAQEVFADWPVPGELTTKARRARITEREKRVATTNGRE